MQQKLVLNDQGIVMSSDDTIFDANSLADKSILDHFPLVESIFVQLLELESDASSIVLPRVASNESFLPGFYDFTFSIVTEERSKFLIWIINDQTEKYQQMQSDMQARNNRIIANERNLNAI